MRLRVRLRVRGGGVSDKKERQDLREDQCLDLIISLSRSAASGLGQKELFSLAR